jgi:hypothetical protein
MPAIPPLLRQWSMDLTGPASRLLPRYRWDRVACNCGCRLYDFSVSGYQPLIVLLVTSGSGPVMLPGEAAFCFRPVSSTGA